MLPPPGTRKCHRRSLTEPALNLVHETVGQGHPSEVLIRAHAVSLNFRDANILHGKNPWPVLNHGIPCSDAAAEIVEIGSNVKKFGLGDRVSPIFDTASIIGREQDRCWLAADVDGVLADYIVFHENHVVKIPDSISWKEASLLPCTGLTAWSALKGAKIGDTAQGGFGLMALKLARAAGCKVILTLSSDEKLERFKNILQHPPLLPINYAKPPDWHEKAIKLNNDRGIDFVLENGGTGSLIKSMKAARRGGTVSQVGCLGKQNANDLKELLPLLIDRRINLRGINVGSKQDFEDLVEAISTACIGFEDTIDTVFTFEDAEEAIEHVWQGKQVGKVVIEL